MLAAMNIDFFFMWTAMLAAKRRRASKKTNKNVSRLFPLLEWKGDRRDNFIFMISGFGGREDIFFQTSEDLQTQASFLLLPFYGNKRQRETKGEKRKHKSVGISLGIDLFSTYCT